MSMEEAIGRLTDRISESVPRSENEYLGEDGLLHCSKCHGKVQTEVEILGIKKVVGCICECQKKERDAWAEAKKQEERERQRKMCFLKADMAGWTFGNDDRSNEKLSNAMQNYVKNFTDFKRDGKGLLLHGTVGSGKTYYAAAIANALIDEDYKCTMRTFKQIERILWSAEDKQACIDDLNKCSLLIFDDLGAERDSKYMQDIVFDAIDTRYKSGLPFIVTTNLTIEEIKKPQDLGCARIYDRILERCFPVEVSGVSRRRMKVKETFFDVKEKLGL